MHIRKERKVCTIQAWKMTTVARCTRNKSVLFLKSIPKAVEESTDKLFTEMVGLDQLNHQKLH